VVRTAAIVSVTFTGITCVAPSSTRLVGSNPLRSSEE
jgi:hypothetical protein